jgi:hypothetical protein
MDVEKRISRIERVTIRVGVLVLVILTLLALVLDKLIWVVKTIFHALSS